MVIKGECFELIQSTGVDRTGQLVIGKRNSRTASDNNNNNGASVSEMRGNILSDTNGNVSFTVILCNVSILCFFNYNSYLSEGSYTI